MSAEELQEAEANPRHHTDPSPCLQALILHPLSLQYHRELPQASHSRMVYLTAKVIVDWLVVVPAVIKAGTLPEGTPAGIRAFTWSTPATRPGAAPA